MPTKEMTDRGHQQGRLSVELRSHRFMMTWILSSGEGKGMCRFFQAIEHNSD